MKTYKPTLKTQIIGRYYSIKYAIKRIIKDLKIIIAVAKIVFSENGKLINIVDEFAEKYPGDVSVASFVLWLYTRSVESKEEFDVKNKTITLTFKMED